MPVKKHNKEPSKLNDKQKMFCLEYIKDLNSTQAAIRSGYSEKTANRIGSENLTKLDIQAEIQRLMDSRAKKVTITAENILESILDIRDTCATKYALTHKVTGEKLGESMVDIQGALKANELLGKHLKLFTDKVEVDGTVNIVISGQVKDWGV